MSETEAARLSRLLFGAREELEMWADSVRNETGADPKATRDLIAEIDRFRAEQGWSPDGFGGES